MRLKSYSEAYEEIISTPYDKIKKDPELYEMFYAYVCHVIKNFEFWNGGDCESCKRNVMQEIRENGLQAAQKLDEINARNWRLKDIGLRSTFYVNDGQRPCLGRDLTEEQAKELYLSGAIKPELWETEPVEWNETEIIVKKKTKK